MEMSMQADGTLSGKSPTLQEMVEAKRMGFGKAIVTAMGAGFGIPGFVALGMSKAGIGLGLGGTKLGFASAGAGKLVKLGALAKVMGAGTFIMGGAALVGAAIAAVGTVAFAEEARQGKRLEYVFDAPETKRIRDELEARAEGLFAAQRGTVWFVIGPGDAEPMVFDEDGYKKFKKTLAEGSHLDEFRIDGEKIQVMRYVGGKLDAGDRDVPAAVEFKLLHSEEIDLPAAALAAAPKVGWFSEGKRTTAEFVSSRNAERRAQAGYGGEEPACG